MNTERISFDHRLNLSIDCILPADLHGAYGNLIHDLVEFDRLCYQYHAQSHVQHHAFQFLPAE